MLKETFLIENMSCGHCVHQVKNLLEKQVGVMLVDVSLDTKLATIEFDEQKTSIDILKNTINQSEIYKTN
jgi:copper chaperone